MKDEKTKELSKAHQSLIMVLDIVGKGDFEKKKDTYVIKFKGLEDYAIHVNEEAIELRVVTRKWIKGSYEPIMSSEIYRSVNHEELTNLSYEDKIKKIESIIKEKGI
ncbi:hypothetical protein [Candidatus Clostridium stratigraminis]|uniref:Uncharacterized protein n=1 Tax=Candidatus Clostridium stratigraminis TaxID=3381661 RepID=A0ABW8T2H9_9CLOT